LHNIGTIDLSNFFNTKAEANDFVTRLATISENLYQTDFTIEHALMEAFGIKKKDIFILLLREQGIPLDATSALKEFFCQLAKSVATFPVLTITVSFEPKEQTLKTLSTWFVVNTKRQVIFDIQVDPSLLAGAAITFNGKFFDFSVRSHFDQIFNDALTTKENPFRT